MHCARFKRSGFKSKRSGSVACRLLRPSVLFLTYTANRGLVHCTTLMHTLYVYACRRFRVRAFKERDANQFKTVYNCVRPSRRGLNELPSLVPACRDRATTAPCHLPASSRCPFCPVPFPRPPVPRAPGRRVSHRVVISEISRRF